MLSDAQIKGSGHASPPHVQNARKGTLVATDRKYNHHDQARKQRDHDEGQHAKKRTDGLQYYHEQLGWRPQVT